MSQLFIPICLSCCFTVMVQYTVEGADTEKGQGVFKYFSSSFNRDDRFSNLLPDFLWFNVNNNVRDNAFQLGMNYFFEFFGGNAIASEGIPAKPKEEANKTRQSSKIPTGEMDKIIEKIVYHSILGFIIGFLATLPLWWNMPYR